MRPSSRCPAFSYSASGSFVSPRIAGPCCRCLCLGFRIGLIDPDSLVFAGSFQLRN